MAVEWIVDIGWIRDVLCENLRRMGGAAVPFLNLKEVLDIEVERLFYCTGEYQLDAFVGAALDHMASPRYLMEQYGYPTDIAIECIAITRQTLRDIVRSTIGRVDPFATYTYELDQHFSLTIKEEGGYDDGLARVSARKAVRS